MDFLHRPGQESRGQDLAAEAMQAAERGDTARADELFRRALDRTRKGATSSRRGLLRAGTQSSC